MSEHGGERDVFASAECRVCGERVTRLLAPLHIEDHAQRGEFPPAIPPTADPEAGWAE